MKFKNIWTSIDTASNVFSLDKLGSLGVGGFRLSLKKYSPLTYTGTYMTREQLTELRDSITRALEEE